MVQSKEFAMEEAILDFESMDRSLYNVTTFIADLKCYISPNALLVKHRIHTIANVFQAVKIANIPIFIAYTI